MDIKIIIGIIAVLIACIIGMVCIAVSFLDIDKLNEEIEKSNAEPLFGRKSSKKKKTEDNSQKEE